MLEGFVMRLASSAALFTWKEAVPKSPWALGLALAGLLVVGLPTRSVRADTILNSGTTTVSTGTFFGLNLYVATTGTATLNVTGGSADAGNGYVGHGAGSSGTVMVSGGTWTNMQTYVGYDGTGVLSVAGGNVTNTGYGYVGYGPAAAAPRRSRAARGRTPANCSSASGAPAPFR